MSDWTVSANDAVTLSLGASHPTPHVRTTTDVGIVRAAEDKEVLSPNESYEGFHPPFTYPVKPISPFNATSCGDSPDITDIRRGGDHLRLQGSIHRRERPTLP